MGKVVIGVQIVTNTYEVLVWRTIKNLWPKFSFNISYKLGMAVESFFWEDVWLDRLHDDFLSRFIFFLQSTWGYSGS